MPEAPEVYILSIALNDMGFKTNSYGKHLFIYGQDWSFGLNGRVYIKDGVLEKSNKGYLPGLITNVGNMDRLIRFNKLGADWLTSSLDEISAVVNKWKNRGKQLGSLILDQSEIAGMGVAWGSEILHRCGLKPNLKANAQNLDKLAETIVDVGIEIKLKYYHYWMEQNTDEKKWRFIHQWFDNLYQVRTMVVYKKGREIESNGRRWWV